MRRWGRFRIATVDGGRFRQDGGLLFGGIPRAMWQEAIPPDAANRVELALRHLLIVDEGGSEPHRILIDTGLGVDLAPQELEIHSVVAPEGGVGGAVSRAGVAPEAITDVVLSHLHVDHAGGATLRDESGAWRPTFPNATYHVQRRAWKWAEHPTERDRRIFRRADVEVLASSGHLHLIDGPVELFEGVSILLSEGHTVAMQLVLVDGGDDGKLLYAADTIPSRFHIRLPWTTGFDLYPLTTVEEKKLLVAQALAEGWTLFFDHDPEIAACRLTERDGCGDAGDDVSF